MLLYSFISLSVETQLRGDIIFFETKNQRHEHDDVGIIYYTNI